MSSGLNPPVRKPSKIIVPFAEARHWRAGGDYLFQIKMDGCFDDTTIDGYTFAVEQMRDGTRYAHTLLGVPGQWLQDVKIRETMPELRRIIAQPRFQDAKILLCPEFSGGEGLEALLAAGEEGGCAKHLDAPYGEMFVCKRVQVFYCRVIGKDDSTGSVELERVEIGTRSLDLESELLTPNFQLPTSPAGRMPLRGNKFEQVRIGSILKVEAFGLTEAGKLREARPDKDTPTSWLVKF